MPTLPIRTTFTHTVEVGDLERFVKETYNVPCDVIAMEESSNGSNLRFLIDGKIESWEVPTLYNFLQGMYEPYCTRLILNKMCQDGHIPAGTYIIPVFW